MKLVSNKVENINSFFRISFRRLVEKTPMNVNEMLHELEKVTELPDWFVEGYKRALTEGYRPNDTVVYPEGRKRIIDEMLKGKFLDTVQTKSCFE